MSKTAEEIIKPAVNVMRPPAITVTADSMTVTLKVPLAAFEQSWQFLEDLNMRDYYVRIAQERGFSEEELRGLLATFWQCARLGVIESQGYELCLSKAYHYEHPEEFVLEALESAKRASRRSKAL